MRVIDADALRYEPIQKCDRNYRTYNLDDAYEDGYSDAFVDISNAPTIDAVEAIRCKDCRWYAGEGMYCANNIVVKFDHFFCYYGERREDGETD